MIYAMSDIHGCIEAFEKSLSFVNLADGHSTLVLCGDYCDRGPASLEVYQRIMQLQRDCPGQVIALRGNHEEMLLEYCAMVGDPVFTQGWILADSNLATARSFLEEGEFSQVKHLLMRRKFEEAYRFVVDCMKTSHADVLSWIRKLPVKKPRNCLLICRIEYCRKTSACTTCFVCKFQSVECIRIRFFKV